MYKCIIHFIQYHELNNEEKKVKTQEASDWKKLPGQARVHFSNDTWLEGYFKGSTSLSYFTF